MKDNELMLEEELIKDRIYFIRGKQVMLDNDLAKLYGVTTGNFNKAVRRNLDRFPKDFMFQLTKEEYESLSFQFGISKREGRGGRRYLPCVFTENGIAMLSSVLNNQRAISANIQIMRTFTKLREMILSYNELRLMIEQIERRLEKQEQTTEQQKKQLEVVVKLIRQLLEPPEESKKKIGFHI